MSRRGTTTHNVSVHDQEVAELRRNRLTLFLQQFEKEAQARISEMEAKMDNMLTNVDKFFKVELMKMPPSLQNTLIRDLIPDGATSSDVFSALENKSPKIHQPLKRVSSKKVKLSQNSPVEIPGQKSPAKTSKKAKGSASAGNLRALTFLAARTPSRVARMPSRVARPVDPVKTKPVLRSVSSAGDLCSVAGCGPHVTLTTSQGQRFCLSEETKDDINLDLLDDVAMFQMQRLMRLMNYLSSKAKPHEES